MVCEVSMDTPPKDTGVKITACVKKLPVCRSSIAYWYFFGLEIILRSFSRDEGILIAEKDSTRDLNLFNKQGNPYPWKCSLDCPVNHHVCSNHVGECPRVRSMINEILGQSRRMQAEAYRVQEKKSGNCICSIFARITQPRCSIRVSNKNSTWIPMCCEHSSQCTSNDGWGQYRCGTKPGSKSTDVWNFRKKYRSSSLQKEIDQFDVWKKTDTNAMHKHNWNLIILPPQRLGFHVTRMVVVTQGTDETLFEPSIPEHHTHWNLRQSQDE
mmetsp:Transcript_32670/g.79228  ORF Transcript_32670/g.79228 Transcript_32670/m.79228 type:complete len:269 (+) Transcript_32670:127-933(+)